MTVRVFVCLQLYMASIKYSKNFLLQTCKGIVVNPFLYGCMCVHLVAVAWQPKV